MNTSGRSEPPAAAGRREDFAAPAPTRQEAAVVRERRATRSRRMRARSRRRRALQQPAVVGASARGASVSRSQAVAAQCRSPSAAGSAAQRAAPRPGATRCVDAQPIVGQAAVPAAARRGAPGQRLFREGDRLVGLGDTQRWGDSSSQTFRAQRACISRACQRWCWPAPAASPSPIPTRLVACHETAMPCPPSNSKPSSSPRVKTARPRPCPGLRQNRRCRS